MGGHASRTRSPVATFGPPARVYHYQIYTIMVWRKNLLWQLGPAVP
jgi:hypothetical protein